jgi:ribosomal protein S18 acetylase RimI-like enzyme
MQTSAPLRARGFALQAADNADLPWLRALYASTRAEELAAVPWPEFAKRQFLDQQFALQHQHYLGHYPTADYLVIRTDQQEPVGRFYLDRARPAYLLVDISLFPRWRGLGLGSLLIRQSQADAAAQGLGMQLHVLDSNLLARRLYERLGFVSAASDHPGYHRMSWRPEPG